MMTKLREFSKVFIIIVALSFIGLMVFEWGANYSGQQGRNDVVGKVNDKKLSFSQFSELYQQAYQNERTRSGKNEFSEEELQQLRDMVWEQFVQRTLFKEEMEKLGIAVSDSEVVYQIMHYPLDDFRQHPAFQTDGQFDMSKYKAALGNPNIPWQQVENIYRRQIPFVKLQNIISNTARVSPEEVRKAFIKNNVKVKVEYLGVNTSQFSSPDIAVSDEEIRTFYNEHKEDYKQEEQRKLKYVRYPIENTAEDTALVLKEFERIRKRLAEGKNFNDLAEEYSEDPSAQKNRGDLGYFSSGSMVPAFEEAAFAADPGEIVGPVQTRFGYHLIKIEDKRMKDGEQQIKASHILLKVHPAPSHVEAQENEARIFSQDAKEKGFETTAENNDLNIETTPFFDEKSEIIPGIGRNRAILNFAFASDKNSISNAYRLDDAFVVVKVTEIKKEGYRELESVKSLVANRVRLDKARERARAFALKIGEQIESGITFRTIAKTDTSNKIQYDITPMFTMGSNVKGIGRSVKFNANAFALEEGEISDLIETERGFYYQKLLEKTDFDSTAFASQKQMLEQQLLTQKRNQIFSRWYENLKEEADIVDNRKMFNL